MSLKEQLFADLKEAMKQKDTILKDTIQLVRAGVLQIEKDEKIELSDDAIIDVILKELKKCNDVLPDFEKGKRQDLIDEVNRKIDILKSYLPEQLSVDELKEIVLNIVKEINASSIKDMKQVIAIASKKTKGRTESKTLTEITKNILQSL